MKADDVVQPALILVAHHRQSAASDTAVEADEFQMLQHLVWKHVLHLGNFFHQAVMRVEALQVGDGTIGFQYLQRGVIPGVFIQRDLAGAIVGRRLQRDGAAPAEQRLEALERGLRNHRDQDALAVRTMRLDRAKI